MHLSPIHHGRTYKMKIVNLYNYLMTSVLLMKSQRRIILAPKNYVFWVSSGVTEIRRKKLMNCMISCKIITSLLLHVMIKISNLTSLEFLIQLQHLFLIWNKNTQTMKLLGHVLTQLRQFSKLKMRNMMN